MTELATEREELDRTLYGDAIVQELKQFERLRALDPPITCAEIAHRMVWSKRNTRWMLKKMGDNRP